MKNDKELSKEPQGGGKHGGKNYSKKSKAWIPILILLGVIALTIYFVYLGI